MATVEAPVVGITVLYFLAIIVIGYYSRQRLKSATDYYVAGRQVGAVVNGLALESTYLSPASMLGLPAYVFILGYPFWWAMAAIIAGMPIATLLTASALRKYAPTSFADYYADRYNDERLRWVVGIVTVIGAVLYITLSIVGMALFLLAVAKVPYIIGIVVGTIIVMLYVVWGGMIATSWNAAFQAFLMTVAAVIAAVAILVKLGGVNGFYEAVAANNPKFWNTPSDPEPPHLLSGTWIAVIGWFFVWHYGFATMPYTVVRFFTTMDIKTARRSIFWCTLAAGIFYMALQIIGAASKLMIETGPMGGEGANAVAILKSYMAQYGVGGWTDYSMVAAVEALQNPWILGVLCAGGLAIAMSTAAGWVMVVNTIVTRDWGDMMLKSRYAKENPIALARIISVIFLLVGLVIAINPPGLVLDLSGWAFVVIISALGPGLILGLWWKRATRAAMWTTAVIMTPLHLFAWLRAKLPVEQGGLGHHAFFFLNDVLFGDKTALITPHQVWAIPVGFILFIVVSLLTKPVEEEAVQKYCVELTKEV